MRKETLTDKMARKSFESSKIQQSWQVHLQAFRPILEPAFVDNYQAKIHLTAALNDISNRNLSKGLSKLKELRKHIETDADKVAYLFFMGLYCEMAGDLQQMTEMYDYANEYEHNFYLPYMKAAKFHQQCSEYDAALAGYMNAIECFDLGNLSDRDRMLMTSAYMNLASCQTMMHQYDDAMMSLDLAHKMNVKLPEINAVEAVLYAITEEKQKAENSLEQLKNTAPALYETVKISVETIFDKTNPAFFSTEIDSIKIEQFWTWFEEYSPVLAECLNEQQYEEGMTLIAEKMLTAFPFMEEPPIVVLGKNDQGYVIELRDLYFVAICDAYDKMLSVCPKNLKESWQFVVKH